MRIKCWTRHLRSWAPWANERARARPVTRGEIRVLLSAVNKTRPETGCSVSCWSRPTDSGGLSSSHARAASAPAGGERRGVYCFSARREIIWQLAHTTHAPFTQQSASILRRALWSRLNYQAAESGLAASLTHIHTLTQPRTHRLRGALVEKRFSAKWSEDAQGAATCLCSVEWDADYVHRYAPEHITGSTAILSPNEAYYATSPAPLWINCQFN